MYICFLLYGSQNNLKKRSQDWLCVRNCQIPTLSRHTFAHNFEEMTDTL